MPQKKTLEKYAQKKAPVMPHRVTTDAMVKNFAIIFALGSHGVSRKARESAAKALKRMQLEAQMDAIVVTTYDKGICTDSYSNYFPQSERGKTTKTFELTVAERLERAKETGEEFKVSLIRRGALPRHVAIGVFA